MNPRRLPLGHDRPPKASGTVTTISARQRVRESMPTVGRERALGELRADLGAGRSVLLTGAAGVGKTHLARRAAIEASAWGSKVIQVLGSASSVSVPLGSCAHLVPPVTGSVPIAGLIAASLESVRRQAATSAVVVVADDVDGLDDASAILVGHLIDLDGVAVLATVRDPARLPRPLAALLRQGHLETRPVPPLAADDVATLSAALAGGPLDPESGRSLYAATGGNALWVTELLRAAAARRALRPGPRGLRLDTAAAVVGLTRVITERLDDLAGGQRDAAELLAVGGPLPVALLEKLVGTEPPETLAAAGLLALEGLGEGLTARLAHPLHRECLLGAINGIRRRALLRRLVASAADLSQDNPATLVRLALWHAELGETFDPAALGWAAQTVHWGLYELLRRHLSGDPSEPGTAEAGLAVGLRTSEERSEVARRLAAGAWHAERSFAHGLALARALMMRTDQAAEMVALLEALTRLAVTDEERAWLAATHGVWLYWTVGDRAGAIAELSRAAAALDPPWDTFVASARGGLMLQHGDITGGVQLLESAAAAPDAPTAVRVAYDPPWSAALVLSGRALEAADVARRALPLALQRSNQGMEAMAELLVWNSWTKCVLGQYAELEAEGHELAELLAGAEDDEEGALFLAIEARARLHQGSPVSSAAMLETAIARHGPYSRYGFLPLLHTTRAWALAWCGRAEEALAEAAQARRLHVGPRFFDPELDMMEAQALAVSGRRSRAIVQATRARETATRAGCWIYAYLAAYLTTRLAPTPANLAVLRDAARRVDGSPAALAVAHGEALVAGDAAALQDVAGRAVEIGDRLLGLEMLEVAASLVGAGRSRTVLTRIEAQLEQLRAECQGARSPMAPHGTPPERLTARELEIVSLAAQGWTSSAISRELVISVRTVESHLYRAFAKLGVRRREELPAVLARVTA